MVRNQIAKRIQNNRTNLRNKVAKMNKKSSEDIYELLIDYDYDEDEAEDIVNNGRYIILKDAYEVGVNAETEYGLEKALDMTGKDRGFIIDYKKMGKAIVDTYEDEYIPYDYTSYLKVLS